MDTFILVLVLLVVFFAIQSVREKKTYEEELKKKLDKSFGARNKREYKYDEYERIKAYFQSMEEKGLKNTVDDITWNDLSMDSIFKLINNTNSSVGEEYLYKMLRSINFDIEELEEFDGLSEYFLNNPDKAKKLQVIFSKLGRTRSISFYDFIHRFSELKRKSNAINYACIVLTFMSIGLFFVNVAVAAIVLVCVLTFDIYTYYREKAEVDSYFTCCKYLVRLIDYSKELEKQDIEYLSLYNEELRGLLSELKGLKKNMFLISDGSVNDSIVELLLDYIKMLFHVDLIKFNSIVRATEDKIQTIDRLYDVMGRIEASIAVASFKKMLINEYGAYSKPDVVRDKKEAFVSFENMYHPMIEGAVKNSMPKERSVLLTGSNASGKSTFLKTIAINTIMSQTIAVACADSFCVNECLVYSSMALRDDLMSSESYYIVEIKSLKRILNQSINGEKTVMCFVDEVLRGTNTVERIAASSAILKHIQKNNTITFAATHDIELTKLLEKSYNNYHFEEDVVDDDVLFNYRLRKGPATTRNAIRLLKVMGYDEKITAEASNRAEEFLRNGVWK